MKKKLILTLVAISLNAYANDYFYEYGKKIKLIKLSQQRTTQEKKADYYQTEFGHRVGIKNEIIVQCKESTNCVKTLKKYDLLQITKLSNQLFLVTLDNSKNVLNISQQLHNDTNIQFAHPNFIRTKRRR